jgi:imidazolonepropionase
VREIFYGHCALADVDAAGQLRFVPDGLVHVVDGTIVAAGPRDHLRAIERRLPMIDLGGRLVTPGLIDCHTHAIYAGNRLGDLLARRDPTDPGRAALESGGIAATVAATRQAPRQTLAELAKHRLDQMAAHGVRTVEIKSGYGLSLADEARLLEIARELNGYRDIAVITSFLGAHALPVEFAGRPEDYIAFMANDVMPALAAQGLIDMVDCFLDPEGFSPDLIHPYLAQARALGLPVRAHVDQFGPAGGAECALSYGAVSLDHVEHISAEAIQHASAQGTVAVLLPFAYLHSGFSTPPPIERLRDAGVALAVATDLNPGTSPTTSLLLSAYLAVTLYGLRPVEAFGGITRFAARALGIKDRGSLDPGMRADLVTWEVDHPWELFLRVFAERSGTLPIPPTLL